MTTLSADTPRAYELGDRNHTGVVASDVIYEGAAVGLSSGYARPLVSADVFVGFCMQTADNSDGSAGDIKVETKTYGQAQLAVASAVITSVGLPVYAIDDNSFTLVASTNTFIGYVKRFVSAGVAIVAFDAVSTAP